LEGLPKMQRVTLIAKGEVQRVGYRDDVERIARKLNITGYVENQKPYDVKIVAEGEAAVIDQFIERIKINRFPIDVERVEVSFGDFKGEFEYFEIKRGEWQEEFGERLDIAGRLFYRNIELSERSVELGERNVALSERSVELSERSVELGERNVALSEESVSIGKLMLDKQDETITELKGVRTDLKSYMEERFERIEHEIAAIKDKVGVV
ncbi:Acylphosphatase, partial [Candidatus Methanophagaceae archaeon]